MDYYYTTQSGYPPPAPQQQQGPPLGPIHQSGPPPPNQQHYLQQQGFTQQQQQQLPPMAPLNSASPHQTPELQPSPRPSTGNSFHPHMHLQSPHQMAPSPIQQPVIVGGSGPPPPPQQPQLMPSPRILTPQPMAVQGAPGPGPQMHQQQPPPMHPQGFMRRPGPPGPPPPGYHSHSPHLPPDPHMHPHGPPPPPPPQHQGYMIPNHHHHHHHHPNSIHQPHIHHNQPGPPMPPHMYDNRPIYYQQQPHISQFELRLIELNKRLQCRPRFHGPVSPLPMPRSTGESQWWDRFACDFFDDDAKLTHRIAPDDKLVEYTIGRTLIPRFFKSYFDGGVVDISIKIRNPRELSTSPKTILLECDQADITTKYNFKHSATNMPVNVVVHTEGYLGLEFVTDSMLIKTWRFSTNQCHEYIDRSMTSVPSAFLVEPVTKQGLTTSTISYLKMCMIMEPMQELMLQHRQTQKDPKACLRQLLNDKFKISPNNDDGRAQPNKRRKRKAPAANGAGTGGNKRTKANAAAAAAAAANAAMNNTTNTNNNNNPNIMNNNGNSNSNNNMGYNNMNNNNGPTVGSSNISLSSQDVMVVGEPSMLGTDFGDENERRITRLENNEFDGSSSVNSTVSNNNTNTDNNNPTMMLSGVGLATH